MPAITYSPAKDIPDLAGKVFFVTGGTGGLGKETIIQLAFHNPAAIYFTGRNKSAASANIATIQKAVPNANVHFIECDLASLASVQAAAKEFKEKEQKLHVLVCNAGIMAVPAALTKDGYEIQFGTNHVGHALLIKLLLSTLEATTKTAAKGDVRIVSLTSQGAGLAPKGGFLFKDLKTPQNNISLVAGNWLRYGQSKLANLVYGEELARRYPDIKTVIIHPGVIKTDLVGSLSFMDRLLVHVTTIGRTLTVEQGAFNTLWAATADGENPKSGVYYEPVGAVGMNIKGSGDEKLATELWEWTEKELAAYE